jgi:hypothetical protein
MLGGGWAGRAHLPYLPHLSYPPYQVHQAHLPYQDQTAIEGLLLAD